MYYCTGDEQVSFQNALAAEATMLANGAQDVEAYTWEMVCIMNVFYPLYQMYYWFDTLRTPCLTNGLEAMKHEGIEMFPNPVTDDLEIKIMNPGKNQIIISDGFGKQIEYIRDVENGIIIPMTSFVSGSYFIEIRMKDRSVIQKVIKD